MQDVIVHDIVTLVGISELAISGKGASIVKSQLSGTIQDAMEQFMAGEVTKKDGFRILSLAQSQCYNPEKSRVDVTITIAFSFVGSHIERPSQKFEPKKISESDSKKPGERETSKFATRPPAVRQPDVQAQQSLGVLIAELVEIPIAPTALPTRASSVPRVRSEGPIPT
ncbi:MAG: hypothetical protein Q7S83_02570 [bacterium]|nr:hypothetical protein [bacterium]